MRDIYFLKSKAVQIYRKFVYYYGFSYLRDRLLNRDTSKYSEETVLREQNYYKAMPIQKYRSELEMQYYMMMGKHLNLDSPQTFCEKIQWMKLHGLTEDMTMLADKYKVRDWVAKTIGEKYLVPLLGKWEHFDTIDFSRLPNSFALKCNHGCGWNYIVKDKSKFDIVDAKKKFNFWMKQNYAYSPALELHYKDIKPLIIAEEYLENGSGDIYDYKFWCFGGKVKFIMLLSERKTELKMANYDLEWNLLPIVYGHPVNHKHVEKPDNLDVMIKLAEKLATGFPHVRVDFYRMNDGTIYFGEMTFTSQGGFQIWEPEGTDEMLGEWIDLKTSHI